MTRPRALVRPWALALLLAGLGCSRALTGPGEAPGDKAEDGAGAAEDGGDGGEAALLPFEPTPATLHRLTDRQWRSAVFDLLGVNFTGELPGDYALHGYAAVGATTLSFAPLELEQVEAAAWWSAEAAVPDLAALEAHMGCPALSTPGAAAPGVLSLDCAGPWVTAVASRAWRRPLTDGEADALQALYAGVGAEAGPVMAGRAVVAAALLAPDFLFRADIGAPDPEAPGRRRYTDLELASRLSFFLTDAPPDAELAAAAAEGALHTDAQLSAQARRLLRTPRAEATLVRWFELTLDLDRIDTMSKDPVLYPELDDALRAEMKAELGAVFVDVVFEREADLRELLESERAYVGPGLAAIYGLEPSEGARWADLLPEEGRGGVLGRAGVLAAQAAANRTSPTHRGRLVRTRLLCGTVPAPPAGVVASLDEAAADPTLTLRERLDQHANDPACAPCHVMMDPIGFSFEHFDAIGRWRAEDNLQPVDASWGLDGAAGVGAAELGAAVAAHPDLPACVARNLLRQGIGAKEGEHQEVAVQALAEDLQAAELRVLALVEAIVLSEAFRTAAEPASGACDEEDQGQTRACATACGEGVETCRDLLWSGCTAPAPGLEVCDGEDNDCDGEVDEQIVASCAAPHGLGEAACVDGAFAACVGPPAPAEVCDGLDNDGDGAIDEVPAVLPLTLSFAELVAGHESCDPWTDPLGPACYAAANRICGAVGCGMITGLVPAGVDAAHERVSLHCLDSRAVTLLSGTYSALGAVHGGCHGGTAAARLGPDCNAAISRTCGAAGLGTGFGPLENSGDGALLACTPGAVVERLPYTALAAIDPECDDVNGERMGPHCNYAIHRHCVSMGFTTGHGPLENYMGDAWIACIGDGEGAL